MSCMHLYWFKHRRREIEWNMSFQLVNSQLSLKPPFAEASLRTIMLSASATSCNDNGSMIGVLSNFSVHRVAALEQAVVDICYEAVCAFMSAQRHVHSCIPRRPSESTSSLRQDLELPLRAYIRELIDATLTGFMRRLNDPERTARIPPELLCLVFQLIDFKDRISTAHVSKHWRAVSLGAPSVLWNCVVARHPRPGVLLPLLQQSQGATVHVDITIRPKLLKMRSPVSPRTCIMFTASG